MSSNTADEYKTPGGGPADPRDDVAQSDPAALASDAGLGGEVVAGTEKDTGGTDPDVTEPNGTQDEPAMDMHDTTTRAKVDGVVAQTRADYPAGSDPDEFEHALRQRFSDVGIDVDDAQIKRLATE